MISLSPQPMGCQAGDKFFTLSAKNRHSYWSQSRVAYAKLLLLRTQYWSLKLKPSGSPEPMPRRAGAGGMSTLITLRSSPYMATRCGWSLPLMSNTPRSFRGWWPICQTPAITTSAWLRRNASRWATGRTSISAYAEPWLFGTFTPQHYLSCSLTLLPANNVSKTACNSPLFWTAEIFAQYSL